MPTLLSRFAHLLPKSLRDRYRETLQDRFEADARSAAKSLAESGDVRTWHSTMHGLVVDHIVAQARLGKGAKLTQEDVDRLTPDVIREEAFLSRFADEISVKTQLLKGVRSDRIETRGLTFTRDLASRSGQYRILWVDVAKVDEDLARDRNFYVGPGGTGAAIGGRYEQAKAFLARARDEHLKVDATRVALGPDGLISIADGRHRFAALRDMGLPVIPISVRRADAERVRQLYGYTSEPMSEKAIAARSALYSGAGRGAYFQSAESDLDDGYIIEYQSVDDDGTCGECLAAEEESPFLPGEGKFPGEVCLGRGRCRCVRVARYAPEEAAALSGEGVAVSSAV